MSRKRFIYQGYLQIAELDAADASESAEPVLRKTYLWDPLEPVATRILAMSVFDETGTYVEDLYYTHDALKNTTALFGIKAGRRALYEYGPYGNVLRMEGNAAEINPFRFSSEYFDEETGLVQYNFRYYNPKDGRWIRKDPIGINGGINMYIYISNMPSIYVDVLGLDRLVFDGKQLCRVSDDFKECFKCWEAVSGKPSGIDSSGNPVFNDFSKERQREANAGPLPEGDYTLPPNKTDDPSESGNWDLSDWNDYASHNILNYAPWRTRIDKRSSYPWGNRFGRLTPVSGTDTYGRSNFNIHGGDAPGSAGCIDIGHNDIDFFNDIRRDFNNPVPVRVDYSGKSSESCDQNCPNRKTNPRPKK